jgi:carboxyl-terminal processing protease
MFPMLAGVGPILGEGTAGYFFEPDRGFFLEFGYHRGAALAGATPVTVVPSPYELLRPGPRVAVITSARTASSGEAIVVAFRGRPNTRFFGSPTCGVPTANQGFRLSDGGLLLLTTALDADRTRRIDNEPLVPDEITTDDEAAPRAVAWIHSGRP